MSLYDIDDLQAVIARNRKVRQAEARKAEGIIEEEIQQFAAWLGSLEVLPTLAALRAHATEIAEQVVAENAGKWEAASRARPRAGRRARAGDRQPAAARADRAAQGAAATTASTRGWRWSATCSASTVESARCARSAGAAAPRTLAESWPTSRAPRRRR